MTILLLVLAYLVWCGLLVSLYLWLGSRRHWQRYDRERSAISRDQHLLLTALRRAAADERN